MNCPRPISRAEPIARLGPGPTDHPDPDPIGPDPINRSPARLAAQNRWLTAPGSDSPPQDPMNCPRPISRAEPIARPGPGPTDHPDPDPIGPDPINRSPPD